MKARAISCLLYCVFLLTLGLLAVAAFGVEETIVRATVTAYTPTDPGCTGKRASDGYDVAKHPTSGVAADPERVPYGSQVWIEGYGWLTVDDRCGAAHRAEKGKIIIDIRMNSEEAALEWGRQVLVVTIRPPPPKEKKP